MNHPTADRNKTALTQRLTRTACQWLDGKGFRSVETEIGVEDGWIADVAAVGVLSDTALMALKLMPPRTPWRSDIDHEAWNEAYRTWQALAHALPRPLTALIEVKTSKRDYCGDRKWSANAWPTNLCYVAMPEGMIAREDWPKGWGVILSNADGTSVRRFYPPANVHHVTFERQMWTILSLATACDFRTRHAYTREQQKLIRLADSHRRVSGRIQDAIGAVLAIQRGESVDRALQSFNIRADLPEHVLKQFERIRPAAGKIAASA